MGRFGRFVYVNCRGPFHMSDINYARLSIATSHQQSSVWFANTSTIPPMLSPSRNTATMPTCGSIAGSAVPTSSYSLAKGYRILFQRLHRVTNRPSPEMGSVLRTWTDVMGKNYRRFLATSRWLAIHVYAPPMRPRGLRSQ
jgi:hypothetical protein